MTDTAEAVAFVREIARSAIWNAAYHEHNLRAAHRKLAFANELLQRCGYHFEQDDLERILQDDKYDEDEEPADVQDFFRRHILGAMSSIRHHEREMRKAHAKLPLVKIMLSRGNYDEISIDEILKAEEERMEGKWT